MTSAIELIKDLAMEQALLAIETDVKVKALEAETKALLDECRLNVQVRDQSFALMVSLGHDLTECEAELRTAWKKAHPKSSYAPDVIMKQLGL